MTLIDAKKLIRAILDFPDCENGYSDAYDKEFIISVVETQPTVDAVPVRHGYWKEAHMSERTGYNPALSSYYDPVYGHVCSLCGGDAIINDCGDELLTEYCPYCGCKMDG